MSMIEKDGIDRIQRLALQLVADASKDGDWFWREPTANEADELIWHSITMKRMDEDEEDIEPLVTALIPLIADQYENQQSVIEDYAVMDAEGHTVAELEKLLRDQHLTPPEEDGYKIALILRRIAETYTVADLKMFSSLAHLTPLEVSRYETALGLRRKLYAKRWGSKASTKHSATEPTLA